MVTHLNKIQHVLSGSRWRVVQQHSHVTAAVAHIAQRHVESLGRGYACKLMIFQCVTENI